MNSRDLLGQATKVALEYRVRNRIALDVPCDIYDLIFRKGIELRFMDVKSLAGFYLVDGTAGQVNICAFRPAGLQRITAAHELGHHVFGHGSSFDPDADFKERFSSHAPEERAAEMFARILMMPRPAVHAGFSSIHADNANLLASDVFKVSRYLGVGYTTLLHQMHYSLAILDRVQFQKLVKARPLEIKRELTPCIDKYSRSELWPIESYWDGLSVHAEAGDIVSGVEGMTCPLLTNLDGTTFQATEVGSVNLSIVGGGAVVLNVSRKEFVGLYEYRYLPEAKDA